MFMLLDATRIGKVKLYAKQNGYQRLVVNSL